MNYLQRSFQISFALHALAVLLLIFMGDRFISSEKMLVIDFTLEDTAGAGNAGDRGPIKTQPQERNAQQKEIRKKDMEAAEPPAEIVPQAAPLAALSAQESPTVEIQMPAVHSETTVISATGEQDGTSKGVPHARSAFVIAAAMNATSGRGAENFNDAGRTKYGKANFSYIQDLINKHTTYPKAARQMGRQGKVTISFFISSDGHARGITIVESSGIGALDKDAVEAVKRASPFPKPPVATQVKIPIRYQLD